MALRTRFGDRCRFAACLEAATSEAGSTTTTGMMHLEQGTFVLEDTFQSPLKALLCMPIASRTRSKSEAEAQYCDLLVKFILVQAFLPS